MPKNKRVNLTVNRVAEFDTTGPGQAFLHDLEVPGLSIRATHGSKTYVFERQRGDIKLRMSIGSCKTKNLSDARKEARRLHALVDQGIDPRKEKAERKVAKARKGLLVSEVFQTYLDAHRKQWSVRHMADNLYLSRAPEGERPGGVLWPLLQKRLSEIDARVLIQWAKDAAQAPSRSPNNQGRLTALRQGYVRFRAFWNWANQRDEYAPLADSAMFKHGDLRAVFPAPRAKNDVLEKNQLETWFEAVSEIQNPAISAYLQVLLLTGARRNELAPLKWSEIDFRWDKIHLHDKIEEGGRTIPLTPYCKFLIEALPKKNEFVFSSATSASGHLVEPRIAHKRALSDRGLSLDLSIHGLRRSFASLSEWVEMPVGIVAQIMGHKPSATAEKHYKVRPIGLLATWHSKLEEWILKQAGIDFNADTTDGRLKAVE